MQGWQQWLPFAEPGKFADIDDGLAQIEGSDVSL